MPSHLNHSWPSWRRSRSSRSQSSQRPRLNLKARYHHHHRRRPRRRCAYAVSFQSLTFMPLRSDFKSFHLFLSRFPSFLDHFHFHFNAHLMFSFGFPSGEGFGQLGTGSFAHRSLACLYTPFPNISSIHFVLVERDAVGALAARNPIDFVNLSIVFLGYLGILDCSV